MDVDWEYPPILGNLHIVRDQKPYLGWFFFILPAVVPID